MTFAARCVTMAEMHDPMTQAFVIPWRYRTSLLGKTPWRYWVPLITVWHVDPERGGFGRFVWMVPTAFTQDNQRDLPYAG